MKKVAIFDIDGTIFRSSLLIELVEKMIAKNLFPENIRDNYKDQYHAWLNRQGAYSDYINAVVEAYNDNIRGVNYADFKEAAHEVIKRMKDRVYCYTRDLVKELKENDYYLLAISQWNLLI